MRAAFAIFLFLAAAGPAFAQGLPRADASSDAVESGEPFASKRERVRFALELRRPKHVRVLGDFGAGYVTGPWSAVDGLHYGEVQGRATAAGMPESPIAWERLTGIDAQGNASALGAQIGLYAGGLAAIIYGAQAEFDTKSGWFGPDIGPLGTLLIPLATTAAGAIVGAAFPTWTPIYRDEPEAR